MCEHQVTNRMHIYTAGSNLALKRAAIARFMFNMAFENSVEAGYVTEKPFDALLAGWVRPNLLGFSVSYKCHQLLC